MPGTVESIISTMLNTISKVHVLRESVFYLLGKDILSNLFQYNNHIISDKVLGSMKA